MITFKTNVMISTLVDVCHVVLRSKFILNQSVISGQSVLMVPLFAARGRTFCFSVCPATILQPTGMDPCMESPGADPGFVERGGGRSGYRDRRRREGFWRVPFEDPLWNFKRGGAPPAPPPPESASDP